jgi:hypothetical protein
VVAARAEEKFRDLTTCGIQDAVRDLGLEIRAGPMPE